MLEYSEIIAKLKDIEKMEFVKTHRKGPTGIGKTLEDLLGIKENNIPGPNAHLLELKSERKNAMSMVTLFTKSPLPRAVNSMLLKEYGYIPEGAKSKKLHTTVNAINFNSLRDRPGFKVEVATDRLKIITKEKKVVCYWDEQILKHSFENKYHNMLYVKAENRGKGSNEEFWYNEAWLLEGFGFGNFKKLVERGIILVDIRIGRNPDGSAHDHGTGFRIFPGKLDLCFSHRERII